MNNTNQEHTVTTSTELMTIETTDLQNVTGGVAWGPIIRGAQTAASWIGGMFSGGGGGGGGGGNVNVQTGGNNRSAQGNQGPVSLGDNSPISTGGGQ